MDKKKVITDFLCHSGWRYSFESRDFNLNHSHLPVLQVLMTEPEGYILNFNNMAGSTETAYAFMDKSFDDALVFIEIATGVRPDKNEYSFHQTYAGIMVVFPSPALDNRREIENRLFQS